MLGDFLDGIADLHKEFLLDTGITVIVNRKGATPTTFTVDGCLVQELRPESISTLRREGVLNTKDSRAVMFVFPGDADVREAVDNIIWDGYNWSILTDVPTQGKTKFIRIRMIGIRRGKAQ